MLGVQHDIKQAKAGECAIFTAFGKSSGSQQTDHGHAVPGVLVRDHYFTIAYPGAESSDYFDETRTITGYCRLSVVASSHVR